MSLGCVQIGTVELLRPRVYGLDPDSDSGLEACVSPGVFPLYRFALVKFWVMEGVLNLGGVQPMGDGIFLAIGGDELSGVVVRFPSKRFGDGEWNNLKNDPDLALRIVET